jgi:hypothetical protein
MRNRKIMIVAALALLAMATAFGSDVTGTWTASFDTQVGVQNYTYTFKVDGGKVTGTAKSSLSEGPSAITGGVVNGDDLLRREPRLSGDAVPDCIQGQDFGRRNQVYPHRD